MALPSSFWLPLAGLLIVAPQPSSAAGFFASATGYALTTSDQCRLQGIALQRDLRRGEDVSTIPAR